jgi:hypothetical protein
VATVVDSPAEEADRILGRFLRPGQSPTHVAAGRFISGGQLERVLALYSEAMRQQPLEASYPWKLASSLDRLGLPDLALPFIGRAVRMAEAQGDDGFGGADAHVAWAEIAINADQPELAGVLLKKARSLDPDFPIERYERELRRASCPPPAAPAANGDTVRKGAAVEHLVAAHCMLASDFELNVSTSDGEVVFRRRGGPTTLAVQVRSRSWAASTMQRGQTFIAEVPGQSFKPRPDLYLLFVAVDARFGEYGPVWFMSSHDFAGAVKPNRRNRLRFSASANPSSRDRWSRYRLERSQLPGRILEELAGRRSCA